MSKEDSRAAVRVLLQFQEAIAEALRQPASDGALLSPFEETLRVVASDRTTPSLEYSDFPVWLAQASPWRNAYEATRQAAGVSEDLARTALAASLSEDGQARLLKALPEALWRLDLDCRPYLQQLMEANYDRTNAIEGAAAACTETCSSPEESRSIEGRKAELTQGRFCPRPFEFAQIDPDGHLFGCCPPMLFHSYGNVRSHGFMGTWNSARAQAVRASILNGSFRYCRASACPDIQSGALPLREDLADTPYGAIIRDGTTRLDNGPKTINFSYDETCNLKCPSCRCEMKVAKGLGAETVAHIHEEVTGPHLKSAETLIITGSGDPFVSRFYHDFLRTFPVEEYPSARIHLSTNGLLLNGATWSRIRHEAVEAVDVSIDAATPETYRVNRGGDFRRLKENLHFLGSLRQDGQLKRFQMHFVVQANNFREMAGFVELGLEVGADRIFFKKLQDWMTWTPTEFAARTVHEPSHPEHAAFLEALASPELRHPKVDLFDMHGLFTGHAEQSADNDAVAAITVFLEQSGEGEALLQDIRSLKAAVSDLFEQGPGGGGDGLLAIVADHADESVPALLERLEFELFGESALKDAPYAKIRSLASALDEDWRTRLRPGAEFSGPLPWLRAPLSDDPLEQVLYMAKSAFERPAGQTRDVKDWHAVRRALDLSPAAAFAVHRIVIRCKHESAVLLSRHAAGQAVSPVGILADNLGKGDGSRAFLDFVRRFGPESGGGTYGAMLAAQSKRHFGQLSACLRADQRETLGRLGIRDPGAIQTRLDPLKDAVRRERLKSV